MKICFVTAHYKASYLHSTKLVSAECTFSHSISFMSLHLIPQNTQPKIMNTEQWREDSYSSKQMCPHLDYNFTWYDSEWIKWDWPQIIFISESLSLHYQKKLWIWTCLKMTLINCQPTLENSYSFINVCWSALMSKKIQKCPP